MTNMLMVQKIAALQCVWWGCVAVYLGSPRQRLLPKPLPRWASWLMYLSACTTAVCVLQHVYHWLSASFFVFGLTMLSWMLVTLCAGHCSGRSTLAGGMLLMFMIAAAGGADVA